MDQASMAGDCYISSCLGYITAMLT